RRPHPQAQRQAHRPVGSAGGGRCARHRRRHPQAGELALTRPVRKEGDTMSCRIAFAALAAVATTVATADAQDYPGRVVQVVNPYQAGSTTDVLARGLALGLSSRLGQQFVIMNRAGAGRPTPPPPLPPPHPPASPPPL